MADPDQEQRLLSLVLDGLDDLYDQRFGGPAGQIERDERAEVWLMRLMIAAAFALQGSTWEPVLLGAADEIHTLLQSGISGNDFSDAALAVTDRLRHMIAGAL